MKMEKAWRGFKGTKWQENIDVADFIKENYKEYKGDESFLETPTLKTKKVWSVCEEALKVELDKGIYDVEVNEVSGINNFKPGYICPEDDVIVGLQTDGLLKRIVNPFGGMRMVESALAAYGYELNSDIKR